MKVLVFLRERKLGAGHGSTANTGSGTACSQNTGSANGVTDAYTYGQGTGYTTVTVKRNGTQTRTMTYDAMGRVTQKVTPEGGTWTYNYDTANGCTASNGNLTESADPNGNGICYYYDSMNRLTEESANTHEIRYFVYDNNYGTLPTGVTTPTNTLGRIAEAYTKISGTLTTDEWFSYDNDGRKVDFWESTPHSTQYYHSTATFFDNGAVNTLQLASPSLYTITYGLDGEGRYVTLKDGSTTVVAGPTGVGGMYDPAGHVLNVQLTGTTPDQDIYTYDSNTGRMKTFEFEVGNTPANLTGTITWNSNGTVAHVAVVDGFNAGGSSTCYSDSNSSLGYGYDDWSRLMSFDCGSGNVGENYSYDIYDNLNMSVPTGRTGWTLSTTYSSSTNRMTGNTYDSNGNTTADGGSNTYGYNEFSRVKWTATSGTPTCGSGGKCITYDAFGRMVETSNGSGWIELWYPQMSGARVSMSGTSQSFAYWPSPGRGVYAEGSSKFFMHQDWLGNDRIVSATSNHNVTADRDYTPYGQQFNSFGGTNPLYGVFAGMFGDYNAGTLFDTPNREFAVNQVRWLNPDPAGAGWNQYAYVTNPNSQTDPLGLFAHDGCDLWYGCGGGWPGGWGGYYGGADYGGGSYWAQQGLSFFGDQWYDIPGNNGFGSNGVEQEARYVSIMNTGWDPVLGIRYNQTQYWFTDANGNTVSNQRTLDAIKFGELACGGMGAGDVASCIQQTYNTMQIAIDPRTGGPMSEGGHDDYSIASIHIWINGEPVDTTPAHFAGCLWGRCGIFNSADFSHAGTFHVDMANVYFFPIGTIVHTIADLWGGHSWWRSEGVPPFPLP